MIVSAEPVFTWASSGCVHSPKLPSIVGGSGARRLVSVRAARGGVGDAVLVAVGVAEAVALGVAVVGLGVGVLLGVDEGVGELGGLTGS